MSKPRPICSVAAETPCPDPTAHHVWMVMAAMADAQTLTCWPSIATLMRVTGRGETTVRQAIRRLQAAGLVAVLTAGGRSNRYRLVLPDGVQPTEPVEAQGVQPTEPGGVPSTEPQGFSPPKGGVPSTEPEEPRRAIEEPVEEGDARATTQDDEGGRGGADPEPAINRGGGIQSSAPLVQSPLRSLHTCARCGRQWRIHFGNVCQRCHLQVGDPVPPPPDPNADPF